MNRQQGIAVLALAGFFVALYLYLYKIGVYGALQCGTGACETVQASRYAALLGHPVALYGVLGYAALFVVSVLALQPAFAARRWPALALALLATPGWGFTLYLTYLELFVIHAWCRWCAASAAIMTLIFVASLAGLRRTR
ncbi:MAG TPA: vitamin K epoxide reductase family protein [Gemmatimonadales bacterium]|nr:vitamin K epoxide reductase family protein [Gemmatimonadales bacterium]